MTGVVNDKEQSVITRICLDGVTCFKNISTLKTDKKVNLIYGLNGTGKSTLSNFMYNMKDRAFSKCMADGLDAEEVLVYNQQFVRDYFYESNNLKGIFTLSKQNREAEEKITAAEEAIRKLEELKNKKSDVIARTTNDLSQRRLSAVESVWEIKRTYTGGDRVLEFCLEGLRGQKEKLFSHIEGIAKPAQKPERTPKDLKREAEPLVADDVSKYSLIEAISFTDPEVDSRPLLEKEIVGNKNSSVAGLINKLNNSDWVKKGLDYLPEVIDDLGKPCPFCQQDTITKTLVSSIRDYFDETYQTDLDQLSKLLAGYKAAVDSIPQKTSYEDHPYIVERKSEFDKKYDAVLKTLGDNIRRIEDKIKTPSQKAALQDVSGLLEQFNNVVVEVNQKVREYNRRIDNKQSSLRQIQKDFWNIMRWDYDQTLSSYKKDSDETAKVITGVKKELAEIDRQIGSQREIISEQLKNTQNIEEAIAHINSTLLELGIDSFYIAKHSDILYKIVRNDQHEDAFQSLSEGEKMIISFLYFRELCKGKESATAVKNKRIVFIDDPISSLSHIYVFNIGQLIKDDFFNSENYDQVFVLTHSLYFFYELVDRNSDRRKESQSLFRMIKNSEGSQILPMKYDEIQNDYRAYWYIIKDDKQPPALIANCMRNIIEYFFGFIEEKDLNRVFQKPELKQNKYQAFRRYVDRESHSTGQNIFDVKEFNYDDFREAFRLVFKESGYENHYRQMTK